MIKHDCEQNTDPWLALRAGKPTASEFSKLITSTGAPSKSMKAYAEQLAGELYAGKPLDSWEGNKYTERGHEVEDEAVSAYELMKGVDTQSVGFITDDLMQWGCSPDRLVGDDGMLEVKCLPKLHIEAIRYYKKNGRIPTKFVQQTQGQVLIAERKWCDLFFYHTDLPKVIIRVTPDEKVITGLKEQLRACIAERNIVFNELMEM
jgi:hypothetical protein